MARAPADPRPQLTRPLERLIADLISRCEPLQGLDPADVLVVAAGAHGRAAASVRSLDDVAERVHVEGARRRVELALRPPFFLEGEATARLTTIVHELLHLDPARAGRLLEARRHQRRAHAEHEAHAQNVAQGWLDDGDLALLAPLGHDGEVLLRTWRHRPVPDAKQRRYGDDDVFSTPVRLRTPKRVRTTWW
jgi:hypothetical protein